MTKWHKALFIVAFLAAVIALAAIRAHAFTCTATGCSFVASYTEPTTVVTGAPLTNLSNTTLNYTVSVDGGPAGPVKSVNVPATSPNGGGAINQTIVDSALIPGHNYAINGSATATNPSGTSAPSAPFTSLVINRAGEVPPGNPPAGGSFK